MQEQAEPVVSVVMIFFDMERFIQEAIESVFAQTFHDWELLLIDDGSNDGSTAMARSYADQHPDRVCYIEHHEHENRGMSASRNLGIMHARGRYISFLDADDALFPNSLAEQVAILEACEEAALVYGPLFWWYSWSGNPEDSGRDYIESLGVPSNTLIDPPKLLPLFLQNKAAVPSGILVRREAFEEFGAFEDVFRGEYEDQVFLAKLCVKAPIFVASRCWYRYRQRPDASVAVGHATGLTHSARRTYLDWLENYLSEEGVKDREVWWAIRQEYWRYNHPRFFYFFRRNRGNLQRLERWLEGARSR
jgi:glycosyltransferase involved in cell wall biosynthesis